jgi:signal peptidase II
MTKKIIFLSSISFVILLLDQWTKIYVHTHFDLHESITVIKGFFDITYVRNPGAAFGMFGDMPAMFRKVFFLTLTPIAISALSYFLYTVEDEDSLQITAICLVFSGAVGNYIDRIRFEYVIDFLDFTLPLYGSYPSFNVADMAIVVGVFTLFYCFVMEEKNSKKA